jgi:hypothetical protein
VTDDDFLLLPSEGSIALVHPSLIQDIACDSHGGDESPLLSVRGSDGCLGRGCDVILLPLSGGLLLIDGEVGGATWHDDGGQGWWWWWMAVNLGLHQR